MFRLLRFLDFFNILDYSKRISLTNVSLMLLVGKLLVSPNPDFGTIGAVIAAFGNYAHRRGTNAKIGQNGQEPSDSTGDSSG